MSLPQLKTTLWLRWRILANRIRRTGRLGNALYALALGLGITAALAAFALALELGVELLPGAAPMHVMAAWVGLALAFLMFWLIGVITDLQRGDSMSFDNLLHLPVSLSWVFLCNYVGSFVSLSSIFFVPAMLGLSLAMVIVHGPGLLLAFALLFGFLVMVTALTYQLRGWLGRLMRDKRRGRNIVAALTIGLVVLVQLPNLVNLGSMKARQESRRERREVARQQPSTDAGAREASEAVRTSPEAEQDGLDRTAQRIALLVPFGWLPYGMRAAVEGRWLSGAMCALGMLAIGALSLRRSYSTTLAAVTGGGGSAHAPPVERKGEAKGERRPRDLLVARKLPFGTEGLSAVALAGLRSLVRAPEAKLILLSPVILLAMSAVMLRSVSNATDLARFAPLLTLGTALLGMFSIMQLIQNQFGLDRAGFRAYVLSPLPRHEILAGKNLALAPLGIGIGLIALVGMRLFVPFSTEIFLSGVVQLGSSFLVLCLVGNMISVLGPMRLQDQGMRAADFRLRTILWQLGSIVLCPIVLAPLMVPGAVVQLMRWFSIRTSIPIFFVLHVAFLVLAWLVYRWMIRKQGALLQAREQDILEILTRR